MELHEQVNLINSRLDLAEFVGLLRKDLKENPDDWENPSLEQFLRAMEHWIKAMDGFYVNTGQNLPVNPTWKTFADILMASTMYE